MNSKAAKHSLLLALLIFSMSVSGDYVLRVEVFYYSCEGSENCDNEFFVCVRPFNAAPLTDVRTATTIANVTARADILGCLQPPAAFRSNNDFDASGISNFTGQSFLGIPNPMEFPVTASQWEGIIWYLDVVDRDTNTRESDDLVTTFQISIDPGKVVAGRGMTEPQTFNGERDSQDTNLGEIEVSFEVECQPGFVGDDCQPAPDTDSEPTTVPSTTADGILETSTANDSLETTILLPETSSTDDAQPETDDVTTSPMTTSSTDREATPATTIGDGATTSLPVTTDDTPVQPESTETTSSGEGAFEATTSLPVTATVTIGEDPETSGLQPESTSSDDTTASLPVSNETTAESPLTDAVTTSTTDGTAESTSPANDSTSTSAAGSTPETTSLPVGVETSAAPETTDDVVPADTSTAPETTTSDNTTDTTTSLPATVSTDSSPEITPSTAEIPNVTSSASSTNEAVMSGTTGVEEPSSVSETTDGSSRDLSTDATTSSGARICGNTSVVAGVVVAAILSLSPSFW